jgi:hypothetical protein
VLANSPYEDSRDYAAAHPQAAVPLPRGTVGSLERYARAARAVRPLEGRPVADVVEESFRILDEVAQAGYTQWQVVYDLPHATIHFRTAANRERRSVSLATIDFGCGAGGRMLDVDSGRGDVTAAFLPYSPEANERQMLAAFSKSPQFNMPAPAIQAEATLIEMTRRCAA